MRIDWNPYMTYVWTTKEIQQWIDENNPPAMYDGVVWTLKYKKIFTNRYAVKFIPN